MGATILKERHDRQHAQGVARVVVQQMRSPRLIALDLDGTLLNREKKVSARTRDALVRLEAQGCHIVVATGRPFQVMAIFCRGLPLLSPQIVLNGAEIHDPVKDVALHRRTMATADVERAMAFLGERDIPTALFTTNGLYMDSRIPNWDLWEPAPLPPPRLLSAIGRVSDHEVLKVVGHAEPETIDWLFPEAVGTLGGALYVTRTAPTLVEVLHPAVSKGEGLRYVTHLLGIEREDVIAFGDSDNDLPMFAVAGLGVAMGNAEPEIKAAADLITESNEEDGIVSALERLDLLPLSASTQPKTSST